MQIINTQYLANIDISSLSTVYYYNVTETVLIIIDIILENIAAGADYDFQFINDGAIVLPTRPIPVPVGTSKINVQSRKLTVRKGTLLALKIGGLPSDTNVDALITLINATPVEADDIVTTIEPGVTGAITTGLAQSEIRPVKTVLRPIKC